MAFFGYNYKTNLQFTVLLLLFATSKQWPSNINTEVMLYYNLHYYNTSELNKRKKSTSKVKNVTYCNQQRTFVIDLNSKLMLIKLKLIFKRYVYFF